MRGLLVEVTCDRCHHIEVIDIGNLFDVASINTVNGRVNDHLISLGWKDHLDGDYCEECRIAEGI